MNPQRIVEVVDKSLYDTIIQAVLDAEWYLADYPVAVRKDDRGERRQAIFAAADLIRAHKRKVDPQPGDDPYRTAAEAKGWREGGGYIYDSAVFGSWKEAVSWSGEEDGRDEDEQSSNIYDSWQECCKAEDIDVEGAK